MRLATLAILALMGCSSDDGATPTGDPGGTGTPTTSSGTGAVTGTTANAGTATLTGTAYVDGGLWDGASVRFCDSKKCRFYDTDATGTFEFTESLSEWHSLEIPGDHDTDPPYATAYVPVSMHDNEVRNVDLHVMPLTDYSPLVAQATEFQMGHGLYITVAEGDLTEPLLMPVAENVGGVMVDEALWVPTDELPGHVVAQWYTYPWDYHAEAGLQVRLDGMALSLGAGPYKMYVGSYEDFAWLEVGEFTDPGDGWYTSTGTLPLLSTVVLVDMGMMTGGTTATGSTTPTM